MPEHYLAAILAVMLTAVAQLLMAKGARTLSGRRWQGIFLNPRTISAFALLFVTTILNVFAYRGIPLRSAVFILPMTYLFVAVFSVLFLGERPRKSQIAGTLLIVVGIAVYTM